MKYCSHCERSIKFWHFRCQVCGNFNQQLPQIIFSAVICCLLIGSAIVLLDHFAYTEQSPAAAAATVSPNKQAAPQSQPKGVWHRQVPSTWKGKSAY